MEKNDSKQITTKSAFQKAKLVELWTSTKGHISNMCRSVGVTRKTFYKWLKDDKEFNQEIQDAEWDLHDDVRDALIQKIADGSSTDIQFYLRKRHPDFLDKGEGNINIKEAKILVIPSELIVKYGITSDAKDSSQ